MSIRPITSVVWYAFTWSENVPVFEWNSTRYNCFSPPLNIFIYWIILRSSTKGNVILEVYTTAVRMTALYSVLCRSCYVAVCAAWPVLRSNEERSTIIWSLRCAGSVTRARCQNSYLLSIVEYWPLLGDGTWTNFTYYESHNIWESIRHYNYYDVWEHPSIIWSLKHILRSGNNRCYQQIPALQNYAVFPLLYVSDNRKYRCTGTW